MEQLRQLPIYGQRGRINTLIRELDMSQEQFGKHLNRKRETVNGWVNGRQTTDRESARRIAELARERLNLEVDWLDFYEEKGDPISEMREKLDAVLTSLTKHDHGSDALAGLSILVQSDVDPGVAATVADELEALADSYRRIAAVLRSRSGGQGGP